MTTHSEYWQAVLASGGATSIPQWTRNPTGRRHDVVTPVPATLWKSVHALAEDLGVPAKAVLLAAHAKVLSALTGEAAVLTGYAGVPCRLEVPEGSWRVLVDAAAESEEATVGHAAHAVDGPHRTALDLAGTPESNTLDLTTRITVENGAPVIRLTHADDVIDTEHATRVAGYYVSALAAMTADVDAEHAGATLLTDEEWHHQVHGLAGAIRPLPDLRFHELFEERVQAHPHAVAATHAGSGLTYGELNRRANRLARALLARGLPAETVVAVATERTLDWLTAVLAILKAGGVYLPIEPGFPPDRIRTVLTRAEAAYVLTAPGSDANLVDVPAAVLAIPDVLAEPHAETDLDIPVAADQAAYIYFTSGSTGEPKGALCEHGGMLNHLYAKVDDLGVGPGTVVAQTAPQCFDISLWQLVAALMVGGTTHIIGQDVILDVTRFIGEIENAEVEVLQVVPSYLDVVMSAVEDDTRRLRSLRCVSVTGEALKRELAVRWFAAFPDTALVNAYGLTETSDDTNHEVMRHAPERVLLGRPVQNAVVYVVDERLRPVPLGAPGEIVFSGVCVGRGYVNDPHRTAAAFGEDPLRPGERLYRSGDFGRWRPDGKLEFLGRRDAQVKIRGFRIEIGEVDNALLRAPGVRDAAVVMDEGPGRERGLVAFYSAPADIPEPDLRAHLGAALPEYMVPAAFHRLDPLPLTANGKIDRKTLTRLAGERVETGYEEPRTELERELAELWAEVLRQPADRISRTDNFFARGGTSLTAVRLVARLQRRVTLAEVKRAAVLADLAELLDTKSLVASH